MNTPIVDFVRAYAAGQPVRAHMPGHKGRPLLGFEPLDITEIDGADNLYAPEGILLESEANASRLFGARTFYSAEGSSLALRAMLFLAVAGKRNPRVIAGRNAHRSLMSAAALLDFEVQWLPPPAGCAYHACPATPEDVERAILSRQEAPAAVFLTSPDYLGNLVDLSGIAAVCQRRGVPLLVDNAHGAYLKFLAPSRHPIDLGADMCCDSAHKTLPALTGAAYLHIRRDDSNGWADRAKDAMALFGSSSPSYLILQSLDLCNALLGEYPRRLEELIEALEPMKARLREAGYDMRGDEPLKLTLAPRRRGWTGDALAEALERRGIHAEFHDPDFTTLMFAPGHATEDLRRVEEALVDLPRREALPEEDLPCVLPRARMSPRQATLSAWQTLPVEQCLGRVAAAPAVSCPPCVPIVMCGEEIDENALRSFRYYGIAACAVVRE